MSSCCRGVSILVKIPEEVLKKKRGQYVLARASVPIPSGIIELNYRLEDYNLLSASLNMLLRLLPCCPASFVTVPFKYVFFGQEILEDTICNGIDAKFKFTTFETTLHKLPGLYDEIQLL